MTMVPARYRVRASHAETADTVTLVLAPLDHAIDTPQPGQFTMLYAFGIGEVPISVSDHTGAVDLAQTIRAVGAVSNSLHACRPGDIVGVRGPYGTSWGLPAPVGGDLLIMAGGIGLAPVRLVIRHAMAERERYRNVALLIGARTPADLLYVREYESWRGAGIDVRVTVDRADATWDGQVGVVTTALDGVNFDSAMTTTFVCGPEPMMRFSARALIGAGVPATQIRVSLERNMRCGDAECGHCQLGPLLVCRDGPVVGYDVAEPLMACREL
jgi:NAD(P)H-flavin reductase